MKEQQRRKHRRKSRKQKKVKFVFYPLSDEDIPYITKLSCTRKIPSRLSEDAAVDFFAKYGVIRVYDLENNLQIEVWVGARRLRHGTGAEISKFMDAYYKREKIERSSDPDLTDWQCFLGYHTAVFSMMFREKIDSDFDFAQNEMKTAAVASTVQDCPFENRYLVSFRHSHDKISTIEIGLDSDTSHNNFLLGLQMCQPTKEENMYFFLNQNEHTHYFMEQVLICARRRTDQSFENPIPLIVASLSAFIEAKELIEQN